MNVSDCFPPKPLSKGDEKLLIDLEGVITRNLKAVYEVGVALAKIRDKGLYRSYGTFETYCRDKWDIGRRHAYRYIEAAKVVENVTNWTQSQEDEQAPDSEIAIPLNEAQIR